jgi:hypothetical protein
MTRSHRIQSLCYGLLPVTLSLQRCQQRGHRGFLAPFAEKDAKPTTDDECDQLAGRMITQAGLVPPRIYDTRTPHKHWRS